MRADEDALTRAIITLAAEYGRYAIDGSPRCCGSQAGMWKESGSAQVRRPRSHQHGTRLFGLMGRCITASVENLAQRSSIHSIVCSDGDYPGSWFSAIPFIPNCDIRSLADN